MQSVRSSNNALLNPAGCRKPFTGGLTCKGLRGHARHLKCQACHSDCVPLSRRAVLLATAAVGGSGFVTAAADAATNNFDNYKTAPSGLKWLDTQEGSGPPPVKGANIRCHYTGKLTSGAVFDSSYERRKPLTFKIGVRQVIAGWDEGILGDGKDVPPMKEGGKRKLVIPSELGYGKRGAGGVIPPDATLLFDVELLGKR
ncbi:hypothetical protein ABBQ32_008367 [Trebouxia sp. C0010 RCD-2024]